MNNADYYDVCFSKHKKYGYRTKIRIDKNVVKIKGFKNKKQVYYVRIQALNAEGTTERGSALCKPKKAVIYKYRKTIRRADLYANKEFASKKLLSVKKNAEVKVLKKYKRWYKVKYKGKTGYLYNKAFENIVNQKKSTVNEKNYKVFLDDWIFENGLGIRTAYDYVSNTHRYTGIAKFHKYRSAKAMEKHQDEMAVHALTHTYTSCKGYNSLLKAILERQGHETYFVFAHHNKYNGVHVWCVVKTKDGYRHIDSRMRFYLLKESELSGNPHSYDLTQREDSYPPCV